MRTFSLTILASFCVATTPVMAQPPDPSPTTPVETIDLAPFEPTREQAVLEGYVDGVVSTHMRSHRTPGVTVSVVKDGAIVFAKAYGFADLENQTPATGEETLFRIGSVSKTFVWTAIMMLYDRGMIDLDTDVNQYLDGITIPEKFGAPVTLSDIMAHRGGFEDTFTTYTYADDGENSLTDALVQDMPDRVYPPGTRSSYSNWATGLAVKIIEDVTGAPYDQFLNEHFLSQLGMTNTALRGPAVMAPELKSRLAVGYDVSGPAAKPDSYMQIGPYWPIGAMASTSEDMSQWMLLHLGGGEHDGVRIMRPETHAEMVSRIFEDHPGGPDMAHGFSTLDLHGVKTFGHGGATSAFFSNMVLAPELGLGVFVSQNAAESRDLVLTLPYLIVERLSGHSPSPLNWGPESFDASPYTGVYVSNRRAHTTFEKVFSAAGGTKVTAASDGGLVANFGGSALKWRPVSGHAHTFENQFGGRIVFGENADGKIDHVFGPSATGSSNRVAGIEDPNTFQFAFLAALFLAVTTWIGAWRRQGRDTGATTLGFQLGLFALVAAALVLAEAGALVMTGQALSNLSGDMLLNYPPAAIRWAQMLGIAVFASSILALGGLWPAWTGSAGWSLWRRIHYSLFAISLVGLATMLVVWKVIFSSTA